MTKSERVKYGLYGAALGGSIAASIAFFFLETTSLVYWLRVQVELLRPLL